MDLRENPFFYNTNMVTAIGCKLTFVTFLYKFLWVSESSLAQCTTVEWPKKSTIKIFLPLQYTVQQAHAVATCGAKRGLVG